MNIDLRPLQQQALQEIRECEAEIERLEQRKAQLLACINANRGKLELIAELAEKYGTQQLPAEESEIPHAPDHPPAP